MAVLIVLGPSQAQRPAAAEDKRTNRIKVLEATYGGNCAGVTSGNVTSFVASTCNDQDLCNYRVYYKNIGGDPAAGCDKDFRVSYSCGKGKRETCALEAEAGKGGEDGYPNRFCLLHCLTRGTQERSTKGTQERSRSQTGEATPRSGSTLRDAAPAPRTAARPASPAPRAATPPQPLFPRFDDSFPGNRN